MRIMTVRQPWAWAIIHGGKDVENRVRNIAGNYRGPVAIHVAKGLGSFNEREEALQAVYLHTAQEMRRLIAGGPLHGGHIIGVVDLVDVHYDWFGDPCVRVTCESSATAQIFGHRRGCSRWSEPNSHHLVLENPRAMTEPIPYRGALGLRRLDDDTTARVLDALS